jgi:hypothetical protein
VLTLLAVASMWFYVERILIPQHFEMQRLTTGRAVILPTLRVKIITQVIVNKPNKINNLHALPGWNNYNFLQK